MSIIISTHNRKEALRRQLDAVSQLKYAEPYEIIVVDDGSTDGTSDCLADFVKRLSNLQVIREDRNAGTSRARNRGLAAANGDLIAYCDDDDVVDEGWLAALVKAAESADIVSGYNRAWRNPADNGPEIKNLPPAKHLDFLPFAPGSNVAHWRDVTDTIGGWDENFSAGSDVDLSWRAQLAGFRFVVADSAIVNWTLRREGLDVWRQRYRWGLEDPLLVARYQAAGCPQTPPAMVFKRIVALLLWGAIELPAGRESRTRWMRKAAYRCGRIRGSIRHKVRCV